jgi:hypothetical protein
MVLILEYIAETSVPVEVCRFRLYHGDFVALGRGEVFMVSGAR